MTSSDGREREEGSSGSQLYAHMARTTGVMMANAIVAIPPHVQLAPPPPKRPSSY